MTWASFWAGAGLLAWAVYLGGALVMELAWRPAQEGMPMAQIGVACQRMGRRYRWIALVSLAGSGVAGAALMGVRGTGGSRGDAALVGALIVSWCALVALVALMAFVAHPALHTRTPSALPPEERASARVAVERAIRRMDRCLRAELAVALVATALLSAAFTGTS